MDVEIEARFYDDPDVIAMVEAVQAEYVVLYGGPDAAVIAPNEFVPPAGVLLVGVLDGTAVAMAGWRRLPDRGAGGRVAEVKRMYVDPQLRGRGLSRVMLEAAEHSAAQAGVEEFVLNTGPAQYAAVALYETSGYLPSAPFGHYVDKSGALFYAKRLGAPVAQHEARPPERTGLVER